MESCNTQFKALEKARAIDPVRLWGQGVCGREGCGIFTTHFHPGFPAASPYVTSVGGPTLLRRASSGTRQHGKAAGEGFPIHLESPAGKPTQLLRTKATAPTALLRKPGTIPAAVSSRSQRSKSDVNTYCIVMEEALVAWTARLPLPLLRQPYLQN